MSFRWIKKESFKLLWVRFIYIINRLYRWTYGTGYDFTTEEHSSVVEFSYASQTQIIGDSILLVYTSKNDENHIGVFRQVEEIDIENDEDEGNEIYSWEKFSILPETNQILAIQRINYSGPEISILDDSREGDYWIMNCDENTQTRFEYPQIIIIKGIR